MEHRGPCVNSRLCSQFRELWALALRRPASPREVGPPFCNDCSPLWSRPHFASYPRRLSRLAVTVTPAASISFFEPDFNDFLYAPIGCERNGMALSVLSALARLNVDPWREAAELSGLPKAAAAKRLAMLVARLPVGAWAAKDCGQIADRLIELLPYRGGSTVPSKERPRDPQKMTRWAMPILIAAAFGVACLIIVASREPSSPVDQHDMPAFSTPSSPQSR